MIIGKTISEVSFVCLPIPLIALDRLRQCGLFAQNSLIIV